MYICSCAEQWQDHGVFRGGSMVSKHAVVKIPTKERILLIAIYAKRLWLSFTANIRGIHFSFSILAKWFMFHVVSCFVFILMPH